MSRKSKSKVSADQTAARRAAVARFRNRGLTQLEIEAALPKMGIVNPNGEPYTQATISRDCKWLMRQNTLNAMAEISEHKIRQFAEIQELKRAAWGKDDFGTVIRCFEREAKLLGLDAPLEILTNDFDTQAVADIQAGRVTYESLILLS